MLKVIRHKAHPHELDIGMYFSAEPIASHPRNHCIPIIEVFDIPDREAEAIMVMPLFRPFNNPRFKSVGETVEFFRQIFEVSFFSMPWITYAQGFYRVYNSCINPMLHIGTPLAIVYALLTFNFASVIVWNSIF